tara:strand:- start:621 stop:1043 length:423 start_codon:yes stop_codon:yes gene_type:complete
MAGLFFIFSVCIMTAFARLPAEKGIAAMQSINVAIINPLFFAAFFGTAALSVVLAVLSIVQWNEGAAVFHFAGSVLYLVGIILVTMIFNVPLNQKLAAVAPDSAEGASLWARYLSVWTAWNHVRTLASIAAMAAFVLALR